ncbi:hypothetical protein [Algicella marina]|uniref:Uncharacterized protein n=1 Tax=Algicella marina TaxID=2683284 RepID=A0A6P1SV85_9RHOB|nr:hypothetical protein [Algicella marina]QHQ33687.1 hypothetical protein GO499_00095 [Algicella marina]
MTLAASAAFSAGVELSINRPESPVSTADGLAAWDRIHAVVSHPRCANCHTDASNLPMWTGPSFGTSRPHGMNVDAGESRIGAETLPCATCHVESTRPNIMPHAAPHTGHPWMLAPAEFVWFDIPGPKICAQLRDPQRNGGRDGAGLIEHITHDAEIRSFIAWGFDPGGSREPTPGTMQQHLDDMIIWTEAGMPCP